MRRITVLSRRTIRHPSTGGADQYVHEIFRRLSSSYRVTVIGEGSTLSPPSEIVDGIQYFNLRGPLARLQIILNYLIRHSRNTDILIDHADVAVPWFSPILSNKPRITIVHQLVKEIYYYMLPRPWADIGSRAEKGIYRLYAHSRIVVSTPSAGEELAENGLPRKNISVITPGYSSHGRVRLPLNHRTKTICCIGRLVRYKGLQYALGAFREVLRHHPDASFAIAGSGMYENDLRKLASSLAISDNVTFHGRVSHEKKFDLLSTSRAAVFPSVRDGFGISVVEANSVGTPVVGWNVPGARDSILHDLNGLLAPFPNEGIFARNICLLLDDDEIWERLSVNASKIARSASWEKAATDFEKQLCSVQGFS